MKITDETVTMSRAEYDALIERIEDAEDAAAFDAFERRLARDGVDAVVACAFTAEQLDRYLSGEHPIRIWREARALSARALAEQAGISPAYLSQIETGQRDGTVDLYARIARILCVTVDDLVRPAAVPEGAPAPDTAGAEG
jgi:DNA-binding XRE family transcriptional regulator